MRLAYVAFAAAICATACKKTKHATSEAEHEPPAARPSDGPVPQMPALDLPDDPSRAEKVALGHVLFFDKRLSGHGDRACYSCHMNENGNGGKDPIAIGSGDKPLTRHAPVIWNVAYYVNSFYWDGRSPDLEATVKAAWGGPNMDAGTDALDRKAAELAAVAGYRPLFAAAYGASTEIKADQVANAVAEYMRTLVCNDTAYDKLAAGDTTALTDQQKQGLDLFMTKGSASPATRRRSSRRQWASMGVSITTQASARTACPMTRSIPVA